MRRDSPSSRLQALHHALAVDDDGHLHRAPPVLCAEALNGEKAREGGEE